VPDVFDEVEEDLRRDRAEKLWKKYAPYLIAAAVVLVAATGAYSFWQDQQRKRLEASAQRYAAAGDLIAGDRERALAELRGLAQDGSGGFAGLARLKEAALIAERDPAQGLALFRRVAADSALDAELRRTAAAMAAVLAVDAAPRAEAELAAGGLQAAGSPFLNSGREAEALAALRAGDEARARELYRTIADDLTAPPGLRQRAAEMLAALGT
jgi:hypothetical protein